MCDKTGSLLNLELLPSFTALLWLCRDQLRQLLKNQPLRSQRFHNEIPYKKLSVLGILFKRRTLIGS